MAALAVVLVLLIAVVWEQAVVIGAVSEVVVDSAIVAASPAVIGWAIAVWEIVQ